MNGIVDSYLVDLELAMIACSCHFALDLLCYKEEVFVSSLHVGTLDTTVHEINRLEKNPKFRCFQEVGLTFSYIVLHV